MRKYLIGFIAGLLIASAFPVYGAVTSMIGKQVQTENSVVVNGVELEVKAVNIDGTTYTPNRALAEALGAEIGFEDKKVIFDTKEGEPVEKPIGTPEPTQSSDPNQAELDSINARLTELSNILNGYLLQESELRLEYLTNIESREETKEKLDKVKEESKVYVDERDQLEKRKAELEAQTTP